MAHITIFVTNLVPQNNKLLVNGECYVSPNNGPIGFSCEHDWDSIAFDINTMIRDSAVAAVAVAGFNIGANDKKTLLVAAQDV